MFLGSLKPGYEDPHPQLQEGGACTLDVRPSGEGQVIYVGLTTALLLRV